MIIFHCYNSSLPITASLFTIGAVYISTEDVFPSKRLHQLTQCFTKSQVLHPSSCRLNLNDNIFIEHAADVVSSGNKNLIFDLFHFLICARLQINVSVWAAAHLPLPNPTLTWPCYQLTVVGLGEGKMCNCSKADIDRRLLGIWH